MHSKALGDHVTRDPPEVEEKPSIFSWKWWALLFGVLAIWKYSAREAAIWNVSSWASYATVFGVFKPIAAFITTELPWFVPLIKAAWAKVTLVVAATTKVLLGST